MKKILLFAIAVSFAMNLQAQLISDQVSLGGGYIDQVYYQLGTQVKVVSPSDSWDLGFAVTLMDAGVISNEQTITVYNVPSADSNNYATLNTTDYATWPVAYNRDTSWYKGALNVRADASNYFDFGWGKYDFSTHSVHGDSLFVIEKGADVYKFWIRKKTETGDYIIRYRNITNGSNDVDLTIPAASYGTKNFVYLKLETPAVLDLEPASANWDLFFTNYITVIPYFGSYAVTGVLSNIGVKVAEANGVDLSTVSYLDYSNSYKTNMSEIGYDWKSYDYYTGTYTIVDSLIYFVKGKDNFIYSIRFTDFDNTNGVISFETEQLLTGIEDLSDVNISATVYPNPVNRNLNLVYDSKINSPATLKLVDLNGREMFSKNINLITGLNTKSIEIPNLSNGVYQLILTGDNDQLSMKVIVAQ